MNTIYHVQYNRDRNIISSTSAKDIHQSPDYNLTVSQEHSVIFGGQVTILLTIKRGTVSHPCITIPVARTT